MATTNENRQPSQMRLRQVPEDIRAIILKTQAEQKIKCRCHFSQEQTIYKLIRKAAKADDGTI